MFLHLAFIRAHYRLRRHRVELHNSRDNDYHDQQRIHCANADSDSDAHPDAYPNSYPNSDAHATARATPDSNPATTAHSNPNARYSDDYVRRRDFEQYQCGHHLSADNRQ